VGQHNCRFQWLADAASLVEIVKGYGPCVWGKGSTDLAGSCSCVVAVCAACLALGYCIMAVAQRSAAHASDHTCLVTPAGSGCTMFKSYAYNWRDVGAVHAAAVLEHMSPAVQQC
jgi:hypothetical protein